MSWRSWHGVKEDPYTCSNLLMWSTSHWAPFVSTYLAEDKNYSMGINRIEGCDDGKPYLKGPPVMGGKPSPKTAPMSPSRGVFRMPSFGGWEEGRKEHAHNFYFI